jgi:SulP family sulfate permease
MLKPKILTTLQNYTFDQFLTDTIAGLIVGVVALPLAIAFAIASGVSPEKGLFTAVIAGFLISALGGSRVQIGGPTGAFVVIVFGIVQKYGIDGLTVATIMAGILLIVLGLARFGSLIKFIPYPVVVGFTSGIALIIFSSQVNDFLGLKMTDVPAHFVDKWVAYFHHAGEINPYALMVGAGSLLLMMVWRKISKKIPGPLIALIISTLVVSVWHWPVETIGTRFGHIPTSIPTPHIPHVSLELLRILSPAALTIALLAGIEALLSCVVSDGMIGGKHRSNMELVAQGVANIFSPLFGGIPATGAIARTATNINNGGRTPVAGIIHALTLFLIMLFFGRWVTYIPLACLAAILVLVAYHMSEWHSFLFVLKSPKSDILVLLITFGLTVIVDLTVAIQVGILLALLLFMRRMALVTNVGIVSREVDDQEEDDDPDAINKRQVPEGVEIYEINGPFFFGAAHKFREAMSIVGKKPKVRIVRMRNVSAIDATGIQTLKEELHRSKKQGIGLILAGVHAQPVMALEKADLLQEIGEKNLCPNLDESLNRACEILGLPPSTCASVPPPKPQ